MGTMKRALKHALYLMHLTRGAFFYCTLVLVLGLWAYNQSRATTNDLHHLRSQLCVVIHSSVKSATTQKATYQLQASRAQARSKVDKPLAAKVFDLTSARLYQDQADSIHLPPPGSHILGC